MFVALFWLIIIKLQKKNAIEAKNKLEKIVRNKHLNLLLKVNMEQKHDVMDLLPLIITKALQIAIKEKIIEKMSFLVEK